MKGVPIGKEITSCQRAREKARAKRLKIPCAPCAQQMKTPSRTVCPDVDALELFVDHLQADKHRIVARLPRDLRWRTLRVLVQSC